MRRRLTASLTGIALTVAFGCWLVVPRSSAICKENYDRLAPGMTLAEVEAILGGPARDDSTGTLLAREIDNDKAVWLRSGYWSKEEWAECRVNHFRRVESSVATEWLSDTAVITVVFDEATEPRVVRTGFLAVYRKPEGPWPKLRNWLRL